MRFLRSTAMNTLKDGKQNYKIRRNWGVVPVCDKLKESKIRQRELMKQMARRAYQPRRRHSIGRPRLRWTPEQALW